MAEEEKDQEQNEPETEGEAAAEAAAPEEPAAEAPAEEPAAEAPAAPAEAEPAEQLSPKQRRRISRSRATGPGGPPRSLEERLRERAEGRARKAKERTRWRAKQREKKKSPDSVSRIGGQPQDEPAVTRELAARKTRQGVVVSSKADKTITVRIDRVARHRVYGKVMRETGTLHAHDERNEANEGDVVRVAESRPLSRTKRWRLIEILEKAR
jgi:small subunit ribosomal protein S17